MRRTSYQLSCILLLNLFAVSSFAGQELFSITVTVTGAEPNKGQVIISVFGSADNYLKSPLINTTGVVNLDGEAIFELQNIRAGSYAISAIYDQDSNGKLNAGLLGIPAEPVGFSNNAKSLFGPPSFEAAAFELSGAQQLVISLGNAQD